MFGYKQELLVRSKMTKDRLAGVVTTVVEERECTDLMEQAAVLHSSLEKVNRILLQNHFETCISEAIRTGNGKAKIKERLKSLHCDRALTDLRHNGDAPGLEASEIPCERCDLEAVPVERVIEL